MDMTKIAGAFASARERLDVRVEKTVDAYEDARRSVRDFRGYVADLGSRAPTLTGTLLVVTLLVGGGVGWVASGWRMRSVVNAEWRDRIASKSTAVKELVDRANADADALDAAIIQALGATDARLADAEYNLQNLPNARPGGECRIPASRLR